MKPKQVQNAIRDRLGVRVVIYSLLCSTVLSAIAAGVQLSYSYQRQKDDVSEIFFQIEQALASPLEKALWKFDFDQVDVILDGIFANNAVATIRLASASGQEWERGEGARFDLEQSYDLIHKNPDGSEVVVGVLTAFLTLDEVNGLIWAQFWTLVASNLVKAYLSAGIMLLLFYMLVGRHLRSISSFVFQNTQPSATTTLELGRKAHRITDDLDNIVSALNTYNAALADKIEALDQEIAERKTAEQTARRALEVRKQFLANMSHEVRTPLNAIIGLFQLIGMSDIPEAQKKQAQVGLDASYHLLSQLVNVLDLSRIEADALEIQVRSTELRPLIELWEETARATMQRLDKSLDICLSIPSELPESGVLDGKRATQIVNNLTDNALKFTEAGQIHIEVCWTAAEERGIHGILEVHVSDTGCGIPEDHIDSVFDRFFQSDGAHTRENTGTGLGLTISRELATRMNGALVANCPSSRSCYATTMSLRMPLPTPQGTDRV